MRDLLQQVFDGRKVLVTGHTGFKGGWLALMLESLGADVVGYSLDAPSQPSFFEAVGLKTRIEHHHGDIRDTEALSALLKKHDFDAVFHLAAQPLVRLSYDEPLETFSSNVMGTASVLEAIRLHGGVKAVISVTTDKCYDNKEWVWGYREVDPLGGKDPYSASKAGAEHVTQAYIQSFFNPANYGKEHNTLCASVRAGNVIGGGDWGLDRLVPDCVRAFFANEPVTLRYPKAVRPWQMVLDPLGGYLLLAARLLEGKTELSGAWNFGPNQADAWPVLQLVEGIKSQLGRGEVVIDEKPHRPEAGLLQLDCSKARQKLNWQAVYDVDATLRNLAQWYRRFYGGSSPAAMAEFSLGQIDDYFNLSKELG